MKTIQIEIKLYSYNELSEKGKEKAFNEHENFLREYDNMDEWTQKDIKDYVEESININEYLFFESGDMAHVVHFTGKHEKAGKIEFYFQGKTYLI